MTEAPEPSKKRQKRGGKSQQANPTEADKPIDPAVWILLGVLLIGIAGFFYLNASSAGGVDTRSGGAGVQIIFDLVYSILGRNLAFVLFGGLGALSLIWGIIGRVKKRTASNTKSEVDRSDESLK